MFTCPNCGGNLKFDIPSQQLGCQYCQTLVDPYSFEDKEKDAIETTEYDATIFTCPQCGGEILSTDTSAAEFCTFCGASTILYSRLSKEKRPDYILPFTKTKEDCKKAYTDMMKRAIFAPDDLKKPERIDSFRGIYMPYWAFYLTQAGPFTLNGSRTQRRGDFVYTDHYALRGEINAYYKGLSYDASSSFDDNISEKLAPFDVKKMKTFTPSFLSGFYADTADVPFETYQPKAENTACNNSIQKVYQSFPDISVTNTSSESVIPTKVEQVDRTMFPVWFMSYRNGDRVAYATVNGQTGRVVSDLPIDPKKYTIGSLLLAIPLFILLNLFLTLTPNILLIITAVLGILSIITFAIEQRNLKQKKDLPEKQKHLGLWSTVAAVILDAILFFLNPVNDLFYYICVIVTLLTMFLLIKDIILYYNLLATRRLPQFDRMGGDDRA